MPQDKEKSAWEYFKDGFKPTKARADEDIKDSQKSGPSQYELDMKKSREERAKLFKKGFFGN